MQRRKGYLGIIAWQIGLGYIALWAIAFVVLDYSPRLFGMSPACHAETTQLMFRWVCDPGSPLVFLAGIANAVLTATIFAPVYLAAATVNPDAAAIAVAILLVHGIGLPTALLVLIRLLRGLFEAPRWFARGRAEEMHEPMPQTHIQRGALAPPPPPAKTVTPRETFGLRQQQD
jgi:hypothetical protein